MAAYSNFRSSYEIQSKRDDLREARKNVLEKAKFDYEKAERRKQKAEASGEGTWMLQSVNDRIDKEQTALEKVKRKKEKKKKKKEKKEKRKKKVCGSNSHSSDEEAAWVEKASGEICADTTSKRVLGPTLRRESWMDGPLLTDIIPTVTRSELRERQLGEEDRKKAEAAKLLQQPGQHSKELNPYWKDGGTGLPEKAASTSQAVPAAAAGDCGLSWLKKAYDRCKQQALEEGKSLEDLAAERYGSLEKLLSMIKEAEGRVKTSPGRWRDKGSSETDRNKDRDYRARRGGDRDWKFDRDTKDERDGGSRDRGAAKRDNEFEKRDDADGRGNGDRCSRDRDADRDSSRNEDRDSSRNRDSLTGKRQFLKPEVDSDSQPSKKKTTFVRPREDAHTRKPVLTSSSLKGRFAKPADSDEDDMIGKGACSSLRGIGERGRDAVGSRVGGGWRKPEKDKAERRSGSPQKNRHRSHNRSAASSTSSSSPSSSEESAEEREDIKKEVALPPVPAQILSENEMNALGAKILRAEIMGDQDLAAQLKTQLEEAQKAKRAAPAVPKIKNADPQVKDTEDNIVVLTRTGRDGMVRPLPEQEYDRDRSSRKQRKMKKVGTHKGGERERYFDDDDRHDLKKLVEMEKLGTAEDQNAMFARLAGRNAEQTDDDFQVDDIFVSKAAQQQSGARNEEKERSKAIFV